MPKTRESDRGRALRQRRKGPGNDGIIMERQMTDELRRIKVHQTHGEDLDCLYATDTMAIGAEGLVGYRQPILIQLTKSVEVASKIERWLRRSAQGPRGTRLYVEMVGKVTREMAATLKLACLEIWDDKSRRGRFLGITIDSRGKYTWWSPLRTVRRARNRRRRRVT